MDKYWRPYLAELIGTFALVFISAGSVLAAHLGPAPGPLSPGAVIGIALAEGFTLAVALAATVPISGGFLNPAITIMLYVFKRFDLGKMLALIFVQLVGAALAGGLLRLLLSGQETVLEAARLGTPHLNPQAFGITDYTFRSALLAGIGIELVLTFILTFVIFATLLDPRAPRLLGKVGRWLSALWVGLIMAALVLAAFRWTGAAANPARYFGTMIWEMRLPTLPSRPPYADHLAYWIGPIVGALLAGGAYIYLILPPEGEKTPAAPTPATTGKATAGAGSTLFRSKKR